jgi:carboxymethylenebutenolidase
VLSLSGDRDKSVTPDVVHKLEQQLKSLGKRVDVVIYPNADHAFFNDTRPTVFQPEAAADAWQRTIEFFKKHLGQ